MTEEFETMTVPELKELLRGEGTKGRRQEVRAN